MAAWINKWLYPAGGVLFGCKEESSPDPCYRHKRPPRLGSPLYKVSGQGKSPETESGSEVGSDWTQDAGDC